MRKRTLSREQALTILYQADITKRDIDDAAVVFWGEQDEIDEDVKVFAERITKGVKAHLTEVDEKVVQYATNWQLKRMAVIDRNILRLGVFELLYAPDIPPKVSINECVELAKKFGDFDSSKFVNGILDKIHKQETSQQKK